MLTPANCWASQNTLITNAVSLDVKWWNEVGGHKKSASYTARKSQIYQQKRAKESQEMWIQKSKERIWFPAKKKMIWKWPSLEVFHSRTVSNDMILT